MMTAANAEDHALNLYSSGARQILFYLEALARIYRNIHNKKRFERMRVAFKMLEDQLGQIDYYDGFIKELSQQKEFPPVLLNNLKQHYGEALLNTNQILIDEKWMTDGFPLINTIYAKLETAGWKDAGGDRNAVAQTIIDQIEFVQNSYENGSLNFHSIENGVHEFRRQLRWISIYAQSLNGLIQLKTLEIANPALEIYQTKEVLQNPYNKMPEPGQNLKPLYIEAQNFYALSWIIDKGGQLKDEALRIIIIEDALRETKFVAEKEVKPAARKLAINSKHSLSDVKEEMEVFADDFIFNHHILRRIKRDLNRAIW